MKTMYYRQKNVFFNLLELFIVLSLLSVSVISLAFVFHLFPFGSQSKPPSRNAASHISAPYNRSTWKLTFDEEFNGSQVNTAVWNIEDYSAGHYQNCCLFFGTQYFTAQDVSLSQGMLRITSEKRSMGGKKFTSGALTTENKFSFLYGRVDIKARLSIGQGMWPALWLLTGNADHEVDIMEVVNVPNIVYQTFHLNIPAYDTAVNQCVVPEAGLTTAEHTYSVVWDAHSLTWYFDGVATCQVTTSVPQTPMYLLLNTAVGGTLPGAPDSDTTFPKYTDISSVRIYQAPPDTIRTGLTVIAPLHMEQATIARGSIINGAVTYTNPYNTPIMLNAIIITGRTANGDEVNFANTESPVTVYPGDTVTIQASRAIKITDPIGRWYAFSSFQTPDGKWHDDGTNIQYFTVTAS